MKKIITLLYFSCGILLYSQNNFTKGFSEGYKKGFCQDKGVSCIEPNPPISPIPQIGEDLNSYNDGYNRGFKNGLQMQTSQISKRERYRTTKGKFIDKSDNNSNNNNTELLTKIIEFKQREYENNLAALPVKEIKVNPEDYAFINIYRPRKAMGSMLSVDVLINGVPVAKLSSGGHLIYKIYNLSATSITIKSAGIATINIIPSKDKIYYFETKPKFSGFTLQQISNPITDKDLKENRLIEMSDYTF